MDTTKPVLAPGIRPDQCELHNDGFENENPYFCNLDFSTLTTLRMDKFPPRLILHLSGCFSDDLLEQLASIDASDIEVSRDRILYHFFQNDPPEDWCDFLWQTLCLADLLSGSIYDEWEEGYKFLSFPSPEEYIAKLTKCARSHGFKVKDKSDWSIDLYMEKKPTSVNDSVFDCIVGEFKDVNKEMLAFLAQKTTLQDLVTGSRIEFTTQTAGDRENGESE